MNIIWRVVWKEYRTQRTLWLTILITAIALQFFFFWLTYGVGPLTGPFGAAITFAVLYAMASGAVLFAAEREEGTRELLRTLAVPAGRLLAGKFGFAVASTTLMFAALWLIAAVMSGELSPAWYYDSNIKAWQAGGLLAVEVLLWAVFFSLVLRRVLNAVCLTAIVVVSIHSPQLQRLIGISIEGLPLLLPYQLYSLVVLLLVDAWLARRWMGSRAWIPSAIGHAFTRAKPVQTSASASLQSCVVETSPLWRRPLQRLIWQEWRQARAFLGICLIVCGILLLISGTGIVSGGPVLALFILPSTPLLMGLWAFRAEQQGQRFRFLAERGIAPPAVWLSKQTVWLPAAFVLSLLLLATYWAGTWFGENFLRPYGYMRVRLEEDPFRSIQPLSLVVLLYVAVSYSIGQFVSLLLSRTVTAGFIGFVLNCLFLSWIWLMDAARVPLVWSVGAIPLVLLAATLLYSKDWMLQRHGARVWLRLASVLLLVPAMPLVAGVAAFRVWEIPVNGPGFDVNDVSVKTLPAEEATAAIYQQASEALVASAKIAEYKELPAQAGWLHATFEERQWLRENQSALELTLLATAQRHGAFAVQHDAESLLHTPAAKAYPLGNLLLLSARQLEANGELDKALERYVSALRLARHVAHRGSLVPWSMGNALQCRVYQWLMLWAADPEQDQQKLAGALKRVEAESSDFPPASTALKIEYLGTLHVFASLEARAMLRGGLNELLLMRRFAPWELVRARRLLDLVTAESRATLLEMEGLLKRPGVDLVAWKNNTFARYQVAKSREWVRTTRFVREFWVEPAGLTITAIDTRTYRSACLLRLGLIRWRLENGQLPPRLEILQGPARRYTLDPWSGRLFGYLPEGPGTPLKFSNLETSQPLLWSPGANGARVIPLGEIETDHQHYQVVASSAGVEPQPGARGIGLVFPIP